MSNVPLAIPNPCAASCIIATDGMSATAMVFEMPLSCHTASISSMYDAQYSPSGRLYLMKSGTYSWLADMRMGCMCSVSPNEQHHRYSVMSRLRNIRYMEQAQTKSRKPVAIWAFLSKDDDMCVSGCLIVGLFCQVIVVFVYCSKYSRKFKCLFS